MPTSLVFTVRGEERPEIVEALSHLIAASEGQCVESRMAHTAGECTGTLRASVPEGNTAILMHALQGFASPGLQVEVTRCTPNAPAPDAQGFLLEVVGHDHRGLLPDLTQALAQRGVAMDKIQTACTSAPMTGGILFKVTARLRVPLEMTVTELQNVLEHLAYDLMVDITRDGTSASL